MGITANVYRQGRIDADGVFHPTDCTLKGWSGNRGFNEVCVVNAEGPFEPDEKHPAVLIVRHRLPQYNCLHAVLLDHYNDQRHTMFGGNFLYCSDSRFGELCVRLMSAGQCGIQTHAVHWSVGAIPIHDRIE